MENLKKKIYAMHVYESPVGRLMLSATAKGIDGITLGDDRNDIEIVMITDSNPNKDAIAECALQLDEYFKGERRIFDVPLDLRGTEFQRKVWGELLRIPYGETRSYGYIASEIENPKAVRAVGGANHTNPISIIVPCHRVIGSNGKLTGFGGGLWRKEWLLEHENNR